MLGAEQGQGSYQYPGLENAPLLLHNLCLRGVEKHCNSGWGLTHLLLWNSKHFPPKWPRVSYSSLCLSIKSLLKLSV